MNKIHGKRKEKIQLLIRKHKELRFYRNLDRKITIP
jgi:hypothetical protein